MMRIAIVGAGVTGLTAGYELSKNNIQVDIYEKSGQIGGLVETIPIGTTIIEKYYHHIFTNDDYIINLIEEFGLSDLLLWESPKNGIYYENKLHPFTSPLDLLMFSGLSFINRIKMGLLVIKAGKIRDWQNLEKITAKVWIIENAGEEVYEKMWKPLLYSKFGKHSDEISAVWIWNKFKLRGSSRNNKLGKEMLGYLKGSFEVLYQKMAEKIKLNNGAIYLNKTVTKLEPQFNGKISLEASGEKITYDKVLMTAVPENINSMVRFDKIKYMSNICIVLKTHARISPYYWITIADEKSPFFLMLEHTNLYNLNEYLGNVVYLSSYLDADDEMFSKTKLEIKEIFLKQLKKMFPDFNENIISEYEVSKSKFAQPVVYRNYSEILPEHRTHIENLYLSTMAQIYPEDRGQNYAIREGLKVAKLIMEDMK